MLQVKIRSGTKVMVLTPKRTKKDHQKIQAKKTELFLSNSTIKNAPLKIVETVAMIIIITTMIGMIGFNVPRGTTETEVEEAEENTTITEITIQVVEGMVIITQGITVQLICLVQD